MQDEIDKMYQEYLNERLDIIFDYPEVIKDDLDEEEPKKEVKPIDKSKYYRVERFNEGIALVQRIKDQKWNYINEDGDLISDVWFYDGCPFVNGYGIVINHIPDTGYNFIDKNGHLLSNTWFTRAVHFSNGRALVQRIDDYRWNYIDENGNLISEKWFDSAESFSEGRAKVRDDDGYYFIDWKGKPISNDRYDDANDFDNGFAVVRKKFEKGSYKANYIDRNGNIVGDVWYDDIGNFHEGYAVVSLNKKGNNIINSKGELILKKWNDGIIYRVVDGLAVVDIKHGIHQNVVGIDGEFIFDNQDKITRNYTSIECETRGKVFGTHNKFNICRYPLIKTDSFTTVIDEMSRRIHIVCRDVDLKDYELHNNTLINGKEKIKLKYKPVKVFNSNFILCIYDSAVYLYNKRKDEYQFIGDTFYVSYNDNFINNDIKNDSRCVYLVYGDGVYDITSYYDQKLGYNKKILKQGVSILSKEEFRDKDEVKKLIAKEKEEDKRKEEQAKHEKELEALRNLKNTMIFDENEKARKKELALKQLKEALDILGEYDIKQIDIKRRKVSNLFITVDDHKEINPDFLTDKRILRHIDLSLESFANVKISGIDFRGCNINLNPQEVYQKDLRNCNFEGLHITTIIDFTGVNIKGCKFSDSIDYNVPYLGNRTFEDAIYDETTTFNGIPFTEIYGECKNQIHNKK